MIRMPNGVPSASDEALRRAQFAIQSDLPVEAEQLAAGILKANPGHAGAAKIIGYALLMQDRAHDAVAALEKAARSSQDPEIATQLGIALRKTGQTDKALIWLKRAIKKKPAFAAAFHEMGFLLNSLRRFDEAIAVLQQGVDVAPMMAEMSVQLGYVYQAINDRANARKSFARALAINPGHFDAMYGLGSVLMDDHDFAQAADLFRRAAIANPADAQMRISLGNCLLSLGQTDAGYACLRAASARGPEFYGKALKVVSSSGRGRFWLHPSAAAKFFKGEKI